jgi:transcriptional regulator with XRE-family HTH domain
MNLYELEDYKDILKELTHERRNQFGLRFTFEKMALACDIQKTYLSKVLNGSGQLNADQLYSALEYLKVSAQQSDYILLIRDWQLAQNSHRKKILEDKISRYRAIQSKTEANIKITSLKLNNEALWEYHSNFELQLIHIFLTIPKFCNNPHEIGPLLGLNKEKIMNAILKLEQLGLLKIIKDKMVLQELNTHLPDDSPIIQTFRLISRLRTIEYLNKNPVQSNTDNNYSFSVILSAETHFQVQFRKKLIDLIKETHSNVSRSKPENVYTLNIDFLKWG